MMDDLNPIQLVIDGVSIGIKSDAKTLRLLKAEKRRLEKRRLNTENGRKFYLLTALIRVVNLGIKQAEG